MKTNIDIDKKLIARARSMSKARNKRETVEIAFKKLYCYAGKKKIVKPFAGKAA
ncbi:MAG: type II toxin-antitoxin system VapB family antitoxin [Chitinophagaceae bacterium]